VLIFRKYFSQSLLLYSCGAHLRVKTPRQCSHWTDILA